MVTLTRCESEGRQALRPIQSPAQCGPGALSQRVEWPRREAEHSYPFIGEVKNGGTTHPLPNPSSCSGTEAKENLQFYYYRVKGIE